MRLASTLERASLGLVDLSSMVTLLAPNREDLLRGVEPNSDVPSQELLPCLGVDDTRRRSDDTRCLALHEAIEDVQLDAVQPCHAFTRGDLSPGLTMQVLQLGVRVEEWPSQTTSQLPANSGLADTHRSNEDYVLHMTILCGFKASLLP